jgi:hypothetical protein
VILNPHSSSNSGPLPPSQRRWWRADVSPKRLAVLFLLGILQHWAIGLLGVYGFLGDGRDLPVAVERLVFVSFLVHWSSVGGLIGFAVSREGIRGSVIGAIVGLILALGLML